MSLKQQADIKTLQRRVDEQDEEIAALWLRVEEAVEASQIEGQPAKRGPGRPKKVANG